MLYDLLTRLDVPLTFGALGFELGFHISILFFPTCSLLNGSMLDSTFLVGFPLC